MPEDFKKIASFEHRYLISWSDKNNVTENVYWNGGEVNA